MTPEEAAALQEMGGLPPEAPLPAAHPLQSTSQPSRPARDAGGQPGSRGLASDAKSKGADTSSPAPSTSGQASPSARSRGDEAPSELGPLLRDDQGRPLGIDARAETFSLLRALRAHVEWQHGLGASELPKFSGERQAPAAIVGKGAPSAPRQQSSRGGPSPAAAAAPMRERAPRPQAEVPAAPKPERKPAQPSPQRQRSASQQPQPSQNGGSQRPGLVLGGPPERTRPPASSGRTTLPRVAPSQAQPLVADLSPADRNTRLQTLAQECADCRRCGLHKERTQTVFARGNPAADLVFVGEGPGADEDAQGEPFVGAAGQLLDRMIAAMGLSQEEVYICNIVKCRPPRNRTPTREEMDACIPHLHEQLRMVQPKVMVALGATAIKGLLGTSTGIRRQRGTWKIYAASIPLMPTYHPAYLLRVPGAKREVWQDLQKVLSRLGRQKPARR